MSDEAQATEGRGAEDQRSPESICGAKRRDRGICTNKPLANGRCRYHGGKAAKGIRNGSFRTGRYSKALKALAGEIGDRVDDPELLDPRRALAMQEMVAAKLHELGEAGDGVEFREKLHAGMTEAFQLMKQDPHAGIAKMREVQAHIRRGVDETRALAAFGQSAKDLGAAQVKFWQTAMQGARAISPEEFVGLMFRMSEIITEEVNKDAAKRILERTDRELCGGALGLGRQETAEAPRDPE